MNFILRESSLPRFLKIFAVVLIAVYALYQIYAGLYNPLSTETAEFYSGYDGYTIDGLVARNEKIVESSTELVKYYVIDDGEKISKGGVISELYTGSEQITVNNQIKDVNKKIKNIEATMAYNSTQAVDVNLLSTKVYDSLSHYVNSFAAGNFSDAAETSEELVSAINIRQAATGEAADFSGTLAALNNELAALNAQKNPAADSIRADTSGYFVSQVDGYENVLKPADLAKMSPDKLKAIVPEKVPASAVGKIVEDYKWDIVCLISIDESARFSVGKTVTLKTSLRELPEFKATVSAVNKGATGNEAVLVLECEDMNGYVSTARTITVTVVTDTYSGLMVNRKSLRVVDGQLGVYVVSGMQANFVKVEVAKYTEDYAVCIQPEKDKSELRLYDEVIVKGKNLYDGKIIS